MTRTQYTIRAAAGGHPATDPCVTLADALAGLETERLAFALHPTPADDAAGELELVITADTVGSNRAGEVLVYYTAGQRHNAGEQ